MEFIKARTGAVGALLVSIWVLLFLTGCGGDAQPKMVWQGDQFLSFPWPNDLRRHSDGTVDIDGFPGTQNLLLKSVLAKGVPYMDGFGTNSGVLFQFNRALDTTTFPDARGTLADDSALMLVNIDPDSPKYLERVPVRAGFDPVTTLYQPGQLLTLLPVPGYALEPGTRYAAIVFDGVSGGNGNPLQPAQLVSALQTGEAPTRLQPHIWQALNAQWQEVAGYVTNNTAWTTLNIAAFTVYTTMDPTRYAFPVAEAVAAIDDDIILNSVHVSDPGLMCGYYNYLGLSAQVDLPVWQQGLRPYSLSGGMIEIDQATGLAVQQGVESTNMAIYIGCQGEDKPKIPMIYADGTGGTSYAAGTIAGGFYESYPFDQVALSVAPLHSGEREDPILGEYSKFLKEFGVDIPSSQLQGITFYNFLNPAANIGNHIQSAADQLYLRRVALLLPQILQRDGIYGADLNYDFEHFAVRDDSAVLAGHSQGASIVPLALAMDHHFNTGYMNGAATHAYFQTVHRGSVRQLIPIALAGMVQSEVDYFHPLLQVMQMMHEPADSVNYVPYIATDHLLQTAGYNDGCVPREAAAALGFAFTRAGLMQPAEPNTQKPSFFDPDGILDVEKVPLPLSTGNLNSGGVGLFVEALTDHYWFKVEKTALGFFLLITGSDPDASIVPPRLNPYAGDCDTRYEQGYQPGY